MDLTEKKFCKGCGKLLSYEWKMRGWKFCKECNKKWKAKTPEEREKRGEVKDKFTREIESFYFRTIKGMKSTVNHSRQGKPHKQAWGFHIVDPYHQKS